MSRTLHTLTMFAVLVHIVFGCCFHHVHAAGDEAGEAVSCCSCVNHEAQPGDPPSHSGQYPAEGCDHDHCEFVRPGDSDNGNQPFGAELSAAGFASVHLNPHCPSAAPQFISTVDDVGASPPPHVLTQRLLL